MSQQLTLELSDEIYADLQQKADAVGLPVSEWILASLRRQGAVQTGLQADAQQEAARQRFRSHAGAISLGQATDVDNDSIDADLAKAYAAEYSG